MREHQHVFLLLGTLAADRHWPAHSHFGLPDIRREPDGTRTISEPYGVLRLRQRIVAADRHDISSSSILHKCLLCSAPEIQPARAVVSNSAPLNAPVASTPALPGPASPLTPAQLSHRVSRSRSASVRLVSQHAARIQQRLHLPPSFVSPCRVLAGEAPSGNVPFRLCELDLGREVSS